MYETDDLPDLQKARALWGQKRYLEALDLFERVVRKHPHNLVALADASRALGTRYQIDKAEAMLDRMIDLAPERAETQHIAGQSYRMIYRPDKAIACFERALEMDPDLLDSRMELALLYERRGQTHLAELQSAQALPQHNIQPEWHVIEGRLARRRGAHDRAAQALQEVIENDKAFWGTRYHAGMELARLQDKLGEYDLAFQTATQAKTLARPAADELAPNAKWHDDKWAQACQALTSEQIDAWADELGEAKPQPMALLTGPPRSGTTLLENVLDAHPGLISSDERDAFPHFILGSMLKSGQEDDTALDILGRQTVPQLNANRNRYLGFMQAAHGESFAGRLHLDKNPSTTLIVPGVLRLFPECKILLAVRDPRDVVLSCFMTHMPVNEQSLNYLDLKSAAENYALVMRSWLALREQLGPKRCMEVRYEDVVADVESQARRALEFLGLPWDDAVLSFHQHVAGKQVDSPTYEQVAKPIYTTSLARWKHYEKHIQPLADTLQPFIEAFGYASS